MAYFLIVYDRTAGAMIEFREYPEAGAPFALRDRAELAAKYRGATEVEVVVLIADSREVLETTHRRYFEGVRSLLSSKVS